MKIALASARIVDRDINQNLSQMERYMKEAKAEGAELLCFGGAAHFVGGEIQKELPIFRDGLLYVTI